MEKMVAFDICAIVLLVVLTCSIIYRKMYRGVVGRCFVWLVGITLLSAFFDVAAVLMERYHVSSLWGIGMRYVCNSGYLILHLLSSACYCVYVVALTDTWHMLKQSKLVFYSLFWFCFVVVGLLISNPYTQFMFYYDEQSAYVRGSAFWILYVIAFVYVSFSVIYLVKYRRLFTKERLYGLLIIFPLNVCALLVQMLDGRYIIELFFNAVALLCITITVQRVEENIDPITGIRNYQAFATDMKRNFLTGKKFKLITIKLANYDSLLTLLGYDMMNEIARRITAGMSAVSSVTKGINDLYNLGFGGFAFATSRTSINAAEQLAERINGNMAINQMEINIAAYVCVADCPADVVSFKKLMNITNNLDEYLPAPNSIYNVKDVIKKDIFELTSQIDAIIERAFINNSFEVYYQPIYSVDKKAFVSAEALLRLKDEKYGFVPPSVFIPAAEKSGAIHRIGDFVLDEVCSFLGSKEYGETGLEYIEVNLSVAQCMQGDLSGRIISYLKKYNVKPESLNIEITETAVSYSQQIISDNLSRLTQAGVTISLDDYGTGYSNIMRVASLPLKIVKLDKTFADEVNNPKMMIVLENTIAMLKKMNLEIVVEGIETENVAKQFADYQCEYIQGYYYSRPIPKNELIEFLKKFR